ncbi:hypothetical protein E4U55_000444 [Claviceps digitariae]|nr:hypothetical protein E4U55_000444 [Claviceps digitariae]
MRLLPNKSGFYNAVVFGLLKLSTAQIVFNTGVSQDIHLQWAVSPDNLTAAASPPPSLTFSSSSSSDSPSPSPTASPTLYLQIDAPSSSYNWIAVGLGARMLNADIFLIHASSPSDNNITLSTRIGRHHMMPLYMPRKNVRLLPGSGLLDGRLRANIACLACTDLNVSHYNSSDWIVAWSSISPSTDRLRSSNPSAVISKHDQHHILRVNLAQAVLSSSNTTNPFATKGTSVAQTADAVKQLDADDADDDDETHPTKYTIVRLAHGIIMTTVFVLIFPVGSLLVPLFSKWFLHSMSQLGGYTCMWVAFALGYIYAKHADKLYNNTHTKLGTAVVSLLAIQPLLGYLHHRLYTARQTRTLLCHVHVWYGRSLMLLGIINGGLGLQLTQERARAWPIVYSAVAVLLALAYAVAIVFRRSVRKGYLRGEKLLREQEHDLSHEIQGGTTLGEFRFEESDPECLRVSRYN